MSKTLDNGIRLLMELVRAPDGLTVTELARAIGVHRTVAYRLVGTLASHALVEQAPDGRYSVGLGALALSRAVRRTLQSLARPQLRDLAQHTEATAFVAALDGDEAVSVAVVEPVHSQAHVAYPVGVRHPIDRGAGGLAILSGRAPHQGERPEVALARQNGYATSHSELGNGVWGLAAPIPNPTGPPKASIGVIALGPLDESRTAALVIAAAEAIGRQVT